MSIGKRLEKFAKEKFKSVAGLARAMGYPDARNLQPYIYDKNEPGSDILKKLISVGCDINWLLTGNENKPGDGCCNSYVQRLEKIEKEIDKLKIHNYDLINENNEFKKKIEQLSNELLEKNKSIESLFVELGKSKLAATIITELRKKFLK